MDNSIKKGFLLGGAIIIISFLIYNILPEIVSTIVFYIGLIIIFYNLAQNLNKKYEKFPITGWKWIFYFFGWITGIWSPLFWLIMVFLHYSKEEGKFFNIKFHRRVYIWGIAMAILLILISIIAFVWFR